MNNRNIILNCLNDYHAFIPEESSDKEDKVLSVINGMGIECTLANTAVGPVFTRIELLPTRNVPISKLKRMTDDISLCLLGVRVIVPKSGKGIIGIEISNDKPQVIGLSDLLQSPEYLESDAQLPIAVGMDVEGKNVVADLATMPHLLVAGASGQGKTVFLNTLIVSLLAARKPEELQLLLIDSKRVEFAQYGALSNSYLLKVEGIAEPVITNSENAISALNALCAEMERRYTLLSGAGVRSIVGYNDKISDKLPYIVVVIDEFADLIMTFGKDFETPIARLAQKARAVGIHLVLATQRPSKDVITGVIKANFPARTAFKVAQMADSKAILDQGGASNLLGRGDMLFANSGSVIRLQGAFIDSSEMDGVVKSFSEHDCGRTSNFEIKGACTTENRTKPQEDLFDKAVKLFTTQELASTTMLQRKFRIGYNRAYELMEELEAAGIVGPARGGKPREILINPDGTSKPSQKQIRDFTLEEIESKLTEVPMLARGFVLKRYRKDFEDNIYVQKLIAEELDAEHPLRELIWNHIVNGRYCLDAYIKAIIFNQSEEMAEKVAVISPCMLCDKKTWHIVQEWMRGYLKNEDFRLFEMISPCSFDGKRLTLSVPCNYIVDKLENEYLAPWGKIFRIVFGEDARLFYVSEDKLLNSDFQCP